ncbi:MAG: hypothetical protein LBC97_04200 [Bifidobacteriaceae bacterium]|jgi:hypothetical protein|nr:hypothetical protein [Bifidobacteriaceae bacterium]
MTSSFKFDDRALRKALEKEAAAGIADIATGMTAEMETLRRRYRGRPAAEIKPALRVLFARDGGSISEPELTEYAQMISSGTRIEFHADTTRW